MADDMLVPSEPLDAVLEQATRVNPDQYAKNMNLSRSSGLDVEIVSSDPAAVEREVRLQSIDRYGLRKSPATEAYLYDLAKASLSHDDIENLSALERALTPLASAGQATLALEEGAFRIPKYLEDVATLTSQGVEKVGVPRVVNPIRALETLARGARYATDPYARKFQEARQVLPEIAAPFKRVGEVNAAGDEAMAKAIEGDFKPLMQVLTDPEAVTSYGANALPSLLVALASGGSFAAVAAMEGGGELVEQADFAAKKGEIPLAQRVAATTQTAIISGMLEKVGVDYLRKFPAFKQFFKEADAAGVNVSDVLKAAVAEGGTEVLQQLNQNLAQKLTYDPTQELTSGVLQSAIGGMGAGGGIGAVGYVASVQYKKAETAAFDVKNSVNANEQAAIDKMNQYASQSMTRTRDKETFREFVQSIDKESRVYIDGEQAVKYMQEKTPEEIAADPALQLLKKGIDEAQVLGADIAIPVSDFATDVAGSEHFDALRQHMKVNPESSTPFRQAQAEQEAQQYVQGLMTEAQKNVSQYAEAQDIFATVRDQLIDTGRMTQQQAGVMADIVPAWATVQAAHRGIPVSQVYAESGLTIEGPMTGKAAELSKAAMEQPSLKLSDVEQRWSEMGVTHSITEGENISVGRIIVPPERRGQGVGTEAMNALIAYADSVGKRVVLSPATDFGATSAARLKKFYKRFGFVENKGKNKDFAISEAMYRNPVKPVTFEQPVAEGDNFTRWSEGGEVIESEDVNDHRFTQGEPVVLKVYHGTTHKFSVFDAKRGNLEGQFGAINYFTSSYSDANDNYAGDGPDLTSRIEQNAERMEYDIQEKIDEEGLEAALEFYGLEQDAGFDDAMSIAREVSRRTLHGGEEQVMELFVKVKNPFVIGENAEWIEFIDNAEIEAQAVARVADDEGVTVEEIEANRDDYEDRIDEARWEIESDTPNKLIEAIQTVADRYNVDASNLASSIYDLGPAAKPGQIEELLRSSEDYAYAEHPDTGALVQSQMIAEVIEEMGFDSIILRNAEERFSSMNIPQGTAHVHIFDSNNTNIKSVENVGTFDPTNPDIYAQQARGYYDPSQSLIRLTEASNLSTFLHEFAHFMYDMEKKNPNSPFIEKIHQWFKRNAADVAQEANGYLGREGQPIEQPFDGAETATTPLEAGQMMIDVDGVQRPTMNSKGQPIHWSQEGVRNFWRWFGDSKVVDAEGRPLVVYHGTKAAFDAFDLNKVGLNATALGPGFYFTDSEAVAGGYGDKLLSVYLKSENPTLSARKRTITKSQVSKIIEDMEKEDEYFLSNYGDIEYEGRRKVLNAALDDIFNTSGSDADVVGAIVNVGGVDRDVVMRSVIARTKKDGLIADASLASHAAQEGERIFVAFDPTQIKSAVGNVGTFDPVNPNILMQAAYHGSPYKFDKFSLEHMGRGEGAQAYGWGLYFAGNKEVAEWYRKGLAPTNPDALQRHALDRGLSPELADTMAQFYAAKRTSTFADFAKQIEEKSPSEYIELFRNKYIRPAIADGSAKAAWDSFREAGQLYKVEIPEDDTYLLWDKPLSEQSEKVKAALYASGYTTDADEMTGRELYQDTSDSLAGGPETENPDELTSKQFHSLGINGIKYLDGASRRRPLNDVKREFLAELPEDAQFDEVVELLGTGKFSAKNEAVIKALIADDWLGFDYPAQALSSALGGSLSNFDPSPELVRAVNDAQEGATYNYVIFDDNAIQIVETYYQGRMIDKAEGPITAADVTSYLDNRTSGDAAKDAAIERAVHEQFARGFETYLMEGKAPSIELRNVFRTFARWLTQVYKAIKGDLQVNLDDEMRQVFDRMIATDEQIAAAEARTHFAPMFTDAAMAGMTDEEYTEYKKKQEKVRDKATETLRDKLIKQLTRQTEAWWKEEKADLVSLEIERLKGERVYAAIEALRNGQFKLDTALVKEKYSEVRTDKLGRKMTHVVAALTGMTASGGAGVNPDDAAAFLGYGSGDEMIQDIIAAPKIKDVAEQNAQQQMLDKHGDILTDGTIEREADEAMQNEERGKLILDELKVLSRGTNRAVLDRIVLKSLAEENIGKLSFREIQPGKYRAAELRAAQESAAMLAAGNKEGAATAKARQALNYYLGMAATEAKNDTMKIVDRMARYKKKDVREAISKAGNGYLEQLDKILSRFEFRKSATLSQVDAVNENIQAWMKARIEEDGDALVLSAAVMDEGYKKHWKNVPYSELVGINDSVKNIEHVARYSNKITRMQEELDFQQLVQKWSDSMNEKASDKFVSQRTTVADGRNWGRWAMAQMTKVPYLASWLDGGERAGLSHSILVQPFTDAYDKEVRMWGEVGRKVMDAIENRSKEDIKRHNQKVFIPEIKDAKNDGNLYGHQIIAVALNTGNAGNLKKMLCGEGWANPDNDTEITFDNPKLQAVLKHMTRSDWELVQLIWDQMDSLYPELAEVHRRTTGLTPPKVEAVPFKVTLPRAAGEVSIGEPETIEMRGGYYPVKYDPNRSFKAEMNEDKLNAQTDSMFSSMGIQASVTASSINERTKYFAPIRLSLDVVPSHFQETIHYITHHDAVRETNKLLRNPTIAATIKAKLGPEEYAQLKPWLNDIAKDGREAPMKTYWGTILQRLRFGLTLGVMGFKASTGLMQLLGLSNTVAEVGSANVYQAVRSILGGTDDMKRAWEFAAENSKVMSHRTETMDREIKNAMQRIEGKRGFMAAVQEASMKHIAYIQTYIVDLPSWHAAYIKGMKEWGDEKRAYQYADWVVENIQGSGVTKDMAAIMRNQSQEARMFTMFMTFFSSLWNLERDLVRGAASGHYSKTTVAAKIMFIFTLPVFLEMLMRGEFGDDDDDESVMQKYLTKTAMYPVQSVPFARDVAAGVFGEYGYNISPIAQLIEQGTVHVPKLATAPFTDEEITKANVKGATKFIGAAVGVPGVAQAWATGEHLNQVISDGEELTVKELLYGPNKK